MPPTGQISLMRRSCIPSPKQYGEGLERHYREDPRDAVDVSVRVRIGHRVDGEGDVEPVLVGVASGRFDTDASGDAGSH